MEEKIDVGELRILHKVDTRATRDGYREWFARIPALLDRIEELQENELMSKVLIEIIERKTK